MSDITLRNIAKRFGNAVVLRDISLDIRAGEFISLVGPSGCGKSTLLRIIAGLEEQDTGYLTLGGRSLDGCRPSERDIAMVFQSYALYPHMTVRQNLSVPLLMRSMTPAQRWPLLGRHIGNSRTIRSEIAAKVADVAKVLDITALLDRRPAQLSGGQRQRVALGRAMVRHPAAFLMDEPLSNLDACLRLQMRSELVALHRRVKATFVYVTHDQAEAMTMSDRVAVMMRGELLQVAPPQEIYNSPNHIEVASFIGSPRINLFPASIRSDGAVESGSRLRLPLPAAATANSSVLLGVRPEALTLSPIRDDGGWNGEIFHVEHLGAEIFAHVRLREPASIVAIARLDPLVESIPSLGDIVTLRPRMNQVHVFAADGRRLATPSPQARELAYA